MSNLVFANLHRAPDRKSALKRRFRVAVAPGVPILLCERLRTRGSAPVSK